MHAITVEGVDILLRIVLVRADLDLLLHLRDQPKSLHLEGHSQLVEVEVEVGVLVTLLEVKALLTSQYPVAYQSECIPCIKGRRLKRQT